MPNGTAHVAMERLRELAVPELYQRNAFRRTGLSTMATRRTIRQRKQHIVTAARSGADMPAPAELPVPGRRSGEQHLAAFDVIDHPQRRIVDEVFWLWDAPDGACGCDPGLHRVHDAAVRAHARALDGELSDRATPAEGGDDWESAAAAWEGALGHPGFWDHLSHRITALGESRLDLSALPVLQGEVRRLLVAPIAVLAARAAAPQRLIGLFSAWSWVGERLLGEAVEQQLQPELDSVQRTLDRARELNAEDPVHAVSIVEDQVLPQLTRLRAFSTEGLRHPVSRMSDRAALLLNNCVVSSGPDTSFPAGEGSRLLELALTLSTTQETRRIVQDNLEYQALGSALRSLNKVHELLDEAQPERAAAVLKKHVLPALTELRQSEDRQERQSAAPFADATALMLNNCAVALSPSTSPSPAQESFDLLDKAAELTGTRRTRKLIRKNRRRLTKHSRVGPYAVALEAALSGLRSARESLRDDKPGTAASKIEQRVLPRIEELGECTVWKFQAAIRKLSDHTALLLNNCAVALVPEVTSPRQRSIYLLEVASTMAHKGRTRRLVAKNLAELR